MMFNDVCTFYTIPVALVRNSAQWIITPCGIPLLTKSPVVGINPALSSLLSIQSLVTAVWIKVAIALDPDPV